MNNYLPYRDKSGDFKQPSDNVISLHVRLRRRASNTYVVTMPVAMVKDISLSIASAELRQIEKCVLATRVLDVPFCNSLP